MADLPVPEDPRPAAGDAGGLTERVSDADRDRTVTMLREHVVDGRLTLDEFSERMGRALQSTHPRRPRRSHGRPARGPGRAA